MTYRPLDAGAKRLFDLIAASCGLFLLLPVLGLVGIAVLISMGRPVILWQRRLGKNGRVFWLPKFRTMTEERDASGRLVPDEARRTSLGRFLRSTSLDELPELFAVMRGDMSLVGPRPLHVRYRDRYSPEQQRRHEVTPGITGWAQVNGRNALGWDQRFALDVWYVDNRSFWLDLKILATTIFRVLRMENIDAGPVETMPEFLGSGDRHMRERSSGREAGTT